ncbi:MAG: M23 family metallopeptidase, partial [Acidimicrobiales bacterium]
RVLVLPGPTMATARPEPGGAVGGGYTVRFGDTLSSIAGRLGVPAAELATTNGITNPNRLQAGRVLVVRRGWLCPVSARPQFVNDFGYVRPDRPGPHQGIDIFAPRGTPVVAPVSGVLTRFPNPMGGLAVQLQGSDGVRYYGAHLDRYGAVGRVAAGTVIGYVGNTGNARFTSPHLHFEAHPKGGPATDPYATLVKACR